MTAVPSATIPRPADGYRWNWGWEMLEYTIDPAKRGRDVPAALWEMVKRAEKRLLLTTHTNSGCGIIVEHRFDDWPYPGPQPEHCFEIVLYPSGGGYVPEGAVRKACEVVAREMNEM